MKTYPFTSVSAFPLPLICFRTGLILITAFVLLITRFAGAQPFETNITTLTWSDNFDQLGANGNVPPWGWVFAQGEGFPNYSTPLTTSPDICTFNTSVPLDFTIVNSMNSRCFTRSSDGTNASTSTSGGKVNCGDASTSNTNRAMGFATSTPSYKTPTNWIMFGFTNSNPGQPVVSMNVQYNIKRYKQGTFSPAGVIFYYSTDGATWTHLGAGDVTPFTAP